MSRPTRSRTNSNKHDNNTNTKQKYKDGDVSDDDASSEDESKESPSSSSSSSSVPSRFSGLTLYAVLGVSKDAASDVIKKAYRRMALSCHPDLNKSTTATEEFQYLSRCHEILSDTKRRAQYDASGSIELDENGGGADSIDAYEYWRTIFPKITLDDIDTYRAKYISSLEEKNDIVEAYQQYKTDDNLESIFQSIPFASSESVVRICTILNEACGAKISKKRMNQLKRELVLEEEDEADEAEEAIKALAPNEQLLLRGNGNGAKGDAASSSTDGLALIIAQRAKDRARNGHAFLTHMESKYGNTSPPTGSAASSSGATRNGGAKRKGNADLAPTTEMSDAEFEAIQARMMANKRKK